MTNEENQLSTHQASLEGGGHDIVVHPETQNSIQASETKKEHGSINCDTEGIISDQLEGMLIQSVPHEVATDLEKATPQATQDKINQENRNAASLLKSIEMNILNDFTAHEKERSEARKPLLSAIKIFTGIQLVSFNLIIILLVFFSFFISDVSDLSLLFDLLKYYIGATIVELISLIFFIAKATYSSDHVRMMEKLIEARNKDTDAAPDEE